MPAILQVPEEPSPMNCSRCGSSLNFGITSCPTCGLHVRIQAVEPLSGDTTVIARPKVKVQNSGIEIQRLADKRPRVFVAVGLLLLLVAIGGVLIGVYFATSDSKSDNTESSNRAKQTVPAMPTPVATTAATPEPTPSPISQIVPLARGAFSVGARQYRQWRFTVSTEGRVRGRFEATGGQNDIEVYILDEDQFVNFSNGHSTPSFYNSGRVTVSTIDVTLGQGSYSLVFNNGFSLLTPKAVKADINLQSN